MAAKTKWDLSKFRAEDIYRMAVIIEQGGFDFYNRIIDGADNQKVRNEMTFLRDEEARHKAFFQKQLAGMGASADGKIDPALQKLLEAEFLKPLEDLYGKSRIGGNAEALEFGMEIEQKTVDFYSALKDTRGEAAFGKDLELIIDEERRHRQKLNLLLSY